MLQGNDQAVFGEVGILDRKSRNLRSPEATRITHKQECAIPHSNQPSGEMINTRSAFADLLKKCASPYDWHLVEEYQFKGTAKQSLRADGALVDELTELAPEPCRATTSFSEALVKVGGVVVDTGLANTRGRFWVDFSVPELLHGAVVKVELPTEIPIRSSRLQEVSHPLP
jgi:hypothetical protein